MLMILSYWDSKKETGKGKWQPNEEFIQVNYFIDLGLKLTLLLLRKRQRVQVAPVGSAQLWLNSSLSTIVERKRLPPLAEAKQAIITRSIRFPSFRMENK